MSSPSEHREKAVKALAKSLSFDPSIEEALQAAEPHLQRMYWERFRECPGCSNATPGACPKHGAQIEATAQQCESCDDTGIYEEGSEWAPCEECDLGRGFAERLKSHADEVRQRERGRIMREELETKLWLYRCPLHGLIDGGHYSREHEWGPEDGCPLLCADEQECGEEVERFDPLAVLGDKGKGR